MDTAEEQTRSLQLVIGKLSVFAEMVRERLETADWSLRRDIVRTLVKRIEVAEDVVRVVFRIEPGSSEPPTHCHIVKLVVVMHRMLADGTPFAAERAGAAA